MPQITCPSCGRVIAVDPHWAPWCEGCDWGLDPTPEPEAHGALAAWWQRRQNRVSAAEHARLLAAGLSEKRPRDAAIVTALAALVHLVTLAVVALAGVVWLSGAWIGFRVIGTGLLLAIAFQVRPRIVHQLPVGFMVTRERAPHLYGLLDEIAAALGTVAPSSVVIDQYVNASWGAVGWRRRRVMALGLPLWSGLSAQGKVALLGHELGHEVSSDVARGLFVGSAVHALEEWTYLLQLERGVPMMDGPGFATFFVIVAQGLTTLLLLPLVAVTAALRLVLDDLASRSHQVAEHKADDFGAQVGGTDGELEVDELLLTADLIAFDLGVALRQDRSTDLIARVRSFVASVPEHETRRQLKLAAVSLQRSDDTHPPTYRRIELQRRQPHRTPGVVLSAERERLIDTELLSAEPWVRRRLIDRINR